MYFTLVFTQKDSNDLLKEYGALSPNWKSDTLLELQLISEFKVNVNARTFREAAVQNHRSGQNHQNTVKPRK